jgi:anthranilate phosphoribosyltransferase
MSDLFREYVRKIGSGPHTGKDLTRLEAATATRMLLTQTATPAQIGAFLIAHRIKRPTGEELAGMLDAYEELGPKVGEITAAHPVLILSAPYDGRDRTMPLSLITALILAAADQPVLQHGGDRTPTKEGITLIELWRGLGVDWCGLSLHRIQALLQDQGLGFVYLPEHFPQAHALVSYRREIGKRPPLATLELMWCPYAGAARVVAGFVHPPTEKMIRDALALRQTPLFTTVKGLEGSCDLPRERTAIIGVSSAAGFERLHLHPSEYGFAGKNFPLADTPTTLEEMMGVLQGQPGELRQSILWNSGFYLWHCGIAADLTAGFALAETLLDTGAALTKLEGLRQAL